MTSSAYPFWLGGLSASMASCITHPADQTKYRMQVMETRTSMGKALKHFAGRDGIPSLWTGVSASILRQSTYSTARFALYGWAISQATRKGDAKVPFRTVVMCAGAAGAAAGMLGNPCEVVLVRMCADGAKPVTSQYRYNNCFDGLYKVLSREGLAAMYRGLLPNVIRSALMNVSQIATYQVSKSLLLKHVSGSKDGVPIHLAASVLSGTVATTVCAPADVLKSRIQSAAGHQGIMDVIRTSLKNEGPSFLFRGWVPAWLRLGPNTVLMFLFMEQLQRGVDFWRSRKASTMTDPATVGLMDGKKAVA